jgi:hypothetical protein
VKDAPADRVDQRLFALGVASIAAILLVFAWPLLAGDLYTTGDLGRFHILTRHFYSRALAEGHSYLWFPYEFSGFYLHGEGQAAFAHPLNRLQYGWLPFHSAYVLEFMRSWVLLAVGTHLLLRRWQMARPAAAFGALVFTFGSFNFLHFTHMNFTGIVSHLPWLLLFTDVALRDSNRQRVALARLGISLFTASQLLHAHPQVVWMSLVTQGLYVADWLWVECRAGDARKRLDACRAVLVLGGALLIGFVMAGVQLLPLWAALGESGKSDPDRSFTNTYALAPVNIGQLVAPYLFDGRTIGRNTSGFALYVGAALPPLIAWLIVARSGVGRAWPRARWGLVVAVLGFVLALGEWGQLYRLQQLIPVVGLFRAPGRYILVCELGLAVAGAVAFAALLGRAQAGERTAWRALWPVALPGLASLALTLAVLGGVRPAWIPGELPGVVAGPVLLALSSALVVAAARGRPLALAALLVLTAADLGFYGLSYVRERPPSSFSDWQTAQSLPMISRDQRLNRGAPALTTRGVRLASGYVSLTPARTLPLGKSPTKLQRFYPEVVYNSLRVASVASAFGRPVEQTLPRVRMVTEAVVSDDVLDDIGIVDVATTALVASPVALGSGPPGTAKLLDDRPGELRIVTRAASAQLLVISESYHPGWIAHTERGGCELIRVYADFMGCRLDAGEHEVVLRFDPPSHRQGLWVSGAGLMLGALAWAAGSGRLRFGHASAALDD